MLVLEFEKDKNKVEAALMRAAHKK